MKTEHESQLLKVLDEDAPARNLTASKAAFITERDKSEITGFVITSPQGTISIVDKSAVRRLSKEEFWKLMHDNQP